MHPGCSSACFTLERKTGEEKKSYAIPTPSSSPPWLKCIQPGHRHLHRRWVHPQHPMNLSIPCGTIRYFNAPTMPGFLRISHAICIFEPMGHGMWLSSRVNKPRPCSYYYEDPWMYAQPTLNDSTRHWTRARALARLASCIRFHVQRQWWQRANAQWPYLQLKRWHPSFQSILKSSRYYAMKPRNVWLCSTSLPTNQQDGPVWLLPSMLPVHVIICKK